MIGFKNILDATEIGTFGGRSVWKLNEPLIFILNENEIIVPKDFETDLASVPRVPIVFMMWGDRAHREAILHDYLYRIDSVPAVKKDDADWYFREAMISRGQSYLIYQPMYLAVSAFGSSSFHRMNVMDSFKLDKEK